MPERLLNNEKELLLRIAEGNEDAFGLFFRTYAPRLRVSVAAFIKDPYGVTEVLQEAFIKIWLNREKLLQVEHLSAYLKRLALNETFNYLNKLARKEKLYTAALCSETAVASGSAEDLLSFKETQWIVQNAIRSLPPQRRMIYQLSRNKGLNSIEIAGQLQLSPDYVRKAISAARQHIRHHLLKAGKLLTTTAMVLKIFFPG